MAENQEGLGWDTVESSGLIDDFDAVVSDESHFGYDARYGDQLVFILQLETDDPRAADNDGVVTQFYSLGKGWETNDAGETVFNPGNPKGFNKQSNYGMLIESLKTTDAAAVVMDRGMPNQAAVWHGLNAHWSRQEVARKINGEDTTSSVLLMEKFIGVAGEDAPAKAAPKKAAGGGATNPKVLRAKVKKLGADHDDHDEFVAAVMEQFPEVEEHDDLFQEILDEDSELFTG